MIYSAFNREIILLVGLWVCGCVSFVCRKFCLLVSVGLYDGSYACSELQWRLYQRA